VKKLPRRFVCSSSSRCQLQQQSIGLTQTDLRRGEGKIVTWLDCFPELLNRLVVFSSLQMAERLKAPVQAAVSPRFTVEVVPLLGQIGSGSLPVERLPSAGLALAPAGTSKKGTGTALDALATALRGLPLPVIGRIAEDRLLLDLRCLEDSAEFVAQLALLRKRLQ